jgi:hypothetical protein
MMMVTQSHTHVQVAKATLPDGIQIKVCDKCVNGLRQLESNSDGSGDPVKDLKIKKMMLAGQIGGLQRTLAAPELTEPIERAVLNERLHELKASLTTIDKQIAALSSPAATAAAAASSTPLNSSGGSVPSLNCTILLLLLLVVVVVVIVNGTTILL